MGDHERSEVITSIRHLTFKFLTFFKIVLTLSYISVKLPVLRFDQNFIGFKAGLSSWDYFEKLANKMDFIAFFRGELSFVKEL